MNVRYQYQNSPFYKKIQEQLQAKTIPLWTIAAIIDDIGSDNFQCPDRKVKRLGQNIVNFLEKHWANVEPSLSNYLILPYQVNPPEGFIFRSRGAKNEILYVRESFRRTVLSKKGRHPTAALRMPSAQMPGYRNTPQPSQVGTGADTPIQNLSMDFFNLDDETDYNEDDYDGFGFL